MNMTMDWRPFRERQRVNRRNAPFDLMKFELGKACVELEKEKGLSLPVFRARALRKALNALPKNVSPDALLCGEVEWLSSERPPEAGSQVVYEAVCKANRGGRSFVAGYDHAVPNYPELLRTGIGGFLARVEASKAVRGRTAGELANLEGMEICLQALSEFILGYADAAGDAGREEMKKRLVHIATRPPESFYDAVQLIWLVHIALTCEGRGANGLGHLDLWLNPFYETDLEKGEISREAALNLLCHLWSLVEGLHSITNICIGGQKADGSDGVNEVTYLCLEATGLVASPSTNLSARFHDGAPERYHRACAEVIISGIGFPAIFNDHPYTSFLVNKIGISPADARTFVPVGCIEPTIPGRQQPWGDSRFNTPLCLLQALDDMPPGGPADFDELFTRFASRLHERVEAHVKHINRVIEAMPPAEFPDPFLSALTSDCIGRAKDINDGGAEFRRFHGLGFMGLGTMTDSFAAIKTLVIEQRKVPFERLRKALNADFAGEEPLRQMLLNEAPKYGNAIPEVDAIAARIVECVGRECVKHFTCDGGRFVPGCAANIQNISYGKQVGATPDGRKAWTPLSDAASPYYGRDRNGPTAFIGSVSTPDYNHLNRSVVNMRFDPACFRGEEGITRFTAFTKAFVAKRIQELQFNFNDSATLEKAMEHPEDYENLVVRVSGFSAYFTRLDREVQKDIMRRRAHVI